RQPGANLCPGAGGDRDPELPAARPARPHHAPAAAPRRTPQPRRRALAAAAVPPDLRSQRGRDQQPGDHGWTRAPVPPGLTQRAIQDKKARAVRRGPGTGRTGATPSTRTRHSAALAGLEFRAAQEAVTVVV